MVPGSSERKSENSLRALANEYPLCVDLDGTLVSANTLHLGLLRLLRRDPWRAFLSLFSIPAGKARFKEVVALHAPLEAAKLPYHAEFLAYLREQKRAGRRLILVTGADQRVAYSVAAHLQLFESVIASDGIQNVVGPGKAAALADFFGDQPFVYAGDSAVDMPIWRLSGWAIVVNGSAKRKQLLEGEGVAVLREFLPLKVSV